MNPNAELNHSGGEGRRADARRNSAAVVAAAARVFVAAGVDVPVRDIAREAGVGVGTVYRHFPTRADLVIAVYRHQIEECAAAAPDQLARANSAMDALVAWIDLFVDFLATKHGLPAALQGDRAEFAALHEYFLDRLIPACSTILEAGAAQGEIAAEVDAYHLLRGVGNLCIGTDARYEPRTMIALLLRGLRAQDA